MLDNTSPLLSIIIPCYNVSSFLPQCFNCIKNQSYNNLQLIFVNDGSTDNTLEIIKEYCKLNPKAQYVDGENIGVGGARRKGLEKITGEYFSFLDVDDYISNNHFENLVKTITENQADIAVCGFKKIKSKRAENYSFSNTAVKKVQVFYGEEIAEQYLSQKKFDYVLWNKIFSTKILKESSATFIDCRYGEEAYFLFNYFKKVKKAVYYPNKTYLYVQHKKSLMHAGFNPSRLDILKNLNLIKQDAENFSKKLSCYVSSMRSGYAVGLLFFIKKSDYNDSAVINDIITTLKQDVKLLKHCKKTALYRKLFIPLIPPIARLLFRKRLKQA